jgi:hypothetical protein
MRSAFTLLWSHITYSCIHRFRITYNYVESEDSFHQHTGLEIKEETNEMLHWSIVVYGAETVRKYLGSFETWCWKGKAESVEPTV